MDKKADIVIIGGGAAGVFAAINISLLNPDLKVIIFEKSNALLAKVKVSGGGRCNVTHACFEPRELTEYYPRGQKTLIGPFHHFNPTDIIDWFEQRGIQLKTERDGRMFPVSDNSQTIIDCFLDELDKNNVKIEYKTKVHSIIHNDSSSIINYNDQKIECRKILIAAGGFKHLDDYSFIADLGIKIIPPAPSLFTFNLPDNPLLQLQGLVSDVEIKIDGTKFSAEGPLLVTHWGVSGPGVLKLSSWGARFLQEKNYHFNFTINWAPEYNFKELADKLQETKEQFSSKKILNQFDFNIPKKLKAYLVKKAKIDQDLTWANISKLQMNELTQVLNRDTYASQGKTTFKQEFVICGGVDLKEIHFKTMESKNVSNIYFAGEVLDIDGLTGGYNFQSAWTSAMIAAENMTL